MVLLDTRLGLTVGEQDQSRRHATSGMWLQCGANCIGDVCASLRIHCGDLALDASCVSRIHPVQRCVDLVLVPEATEHGAVARAQAADESAQCLLGRIQAGHVRIEADAFTHGCGTVDDQTVVHGGVGALGIGHGADLEQDRDTGDGVCRNNRVLSKNDLNVQETILTCGWMD